MAIEYVDIDLTEQLGTNARAKEIVNKVFKSLWRSYDACPDYDGVWRWFAKDVSDTEAIGLHVGPTNGKDTGNVDSSAELYITNCSFYPMIKANVNSEQVVTQLNSYASNGVGLYYKIAFGKNHLRAYKIRENFYMVLGFGTEQNRENNLSGDPYLFFGIDDKNCFCMALGSTGSTGYTEMGNGWQWQPTVVTTSNDRNYPKYPHYGIAHADYKPFQALGEKGIGLISEQLVKYTPNTGNRYILFDGTNYIFDNLKIAVCNGTLVSSGNKYVIDGEEWLCLVSATTKKNTAFAAGVTAGAIGLLIKC